MKKRIGYLDILRFIAVISVIFIHVNAEIRVYYLNVSRTNYIIFTIFDTFTRTAIPLFLIFTGYFLLSPNKKEDYSSFLKKRMPKLIDSLLFVSIIYYLFDASVQNTNISLKDFIMKFSLGPIKYHLWYMYAIIIIYFFIPFERILVNNLNKKQLKSLIIVIFILGNLLSTVNYIAKFFNYEVLSCFVLNYIIICNNYLFIGYYIKEYGIDYKKLINVLAIMSIIIMPLLIIILMKNNVRNDFPFDATSIFPLFPALVVFSFIKNKFENNKKELPSVITKTAELSLYIYLIHVLVLEVSVKLINKVWLHETLIENIVFAIILAIIVFIGSYILSIIYNWFHKKILRIK